MERKLDVERVKMAVHTPLDYSEYASTVVKDDVNCYTHAIGATSIHMGLRLGELCGKKPINEHYISEKEIEELFIEDMKAIRLTCRKIEKNKDMLKWLDNHEFKPNEAVVFLFVQHNGDGSIRDFHFWRYDTQEGFTEKRFWWPLIKIKNPRYSWPEGILCTFVGAYLIKR